MAPVDSSGSDSATPSIGNLRRQVLAAFSLDLYIFRKTHVEGVSSSFS